jgi:hypothetical protein
MHKPTPIPTTPEMPHWKRIEHIAESLDPVVELGNCSQEKALGIL